MAALYWLTDDGTASNCTTSSTTSNTLKLIWSATTTACCTSNCTTGWYMTSSGSSDTWDNEANIRHETRREAARETANREGAERAERLLVRHLSRKQRREWSERRQFHVTGASGKRYRVRGGTLIANVDELAADGSVIRRLCCHPTGIPICDGLLAQKLMLETDEPLFLRTANVHPALAA